MKHRVVHNPVVCQMLFAIAVVGLVAVQSGVASADQHAKPAEQAAEQAAAAEHDHQGPEAAHDEADHAEEAEECGGAEVECVPMRHRLMSCLRARIAARRASRMARLAECCCGDDADDAAAAAHEHEEHEHDHEAHEHDADHDHEHAAGEEV